MRKNVQNVPEEPDHVCTVRVKDTELNWCKLHISCSASFALEVQSHDRKNMKFGTYAAPVKGVNFSLNTCAADVELTKLMQPVGRAFITVVTAVCTQLAS